MNVRVRVPYVLAFLGDLPLQEGKENIHCTTYTAKYSYAKRYIVNTRPELKEKATLTGRNIGG